jgi:hypothetical protein
MYVLEILEVFKVVEMDRRKVEEPERAFSISLNYN